MTTALIIQARMGSTRLPGKVMKNLAKMPVLWHIIQRVNHASLPNVILVATTTRPEDDLIEFSCKKWGVRVFRGEPEDVLKRYCDGLAFLEIDLKKIDYIVRVTADCPLIDPAIIDEAIQIAITGKYDYVSNIDPPTYPDGLDVEVMSRSALLKAHENASLKSEHEHVTPYIRKNPSFSKYNLIDTENNSCLRWTLDTVQDFRFIQKIYKNLYRPSSIFSTKDVMMFLKDRPDIKNINADIPRNEGYEKSLQDDKVLQKVKQ